MAKAKQCLQFIYVLDEESREKLSEIGIFPLKSDVTRIPSGNPIYIYEYSDDVLSVLGEDVWAVGTTLMF